MYPRRPRASDQFVLGDRDVNVPGRAIVPGRVVVPEREIPHASEALIRDPMFEAEHRPRKAHSLGGWLAADGSVVPRDQGIGEAGEGDRGADTGDDHGAPEGSVSGHGSTSHASIAVVP